MKINMKPMPNGSPASMGTAQWMWDDEVQPSQNSEITYRGPPMQASGKRRYSSMDDHWALALLARRRTESYQRKVARAKTEPMATSFMLGSCQSKMKEVSLLGRNARPEMPTLMWWTPLHLSALQCPYPQTRRTNLERF